MKIQEKFVYLANDILDNPELNKREMEIFLNGLIQGFMALGEDINEWETVSIEAERFREVIRGL